MPTYVVRDIIEDSRIMTSATSTRSMALPKHKRRNLTQQFSSSSSSPSFYSSHLYPFPSPPPTEPPVSPTSQSSTSSSSFSYFHSYRPYQYQSYLSNIKTTPHFFLDSVSTMDEIKSSASITLRRDRISPYPTSVDESFRKIRSSMSLSAVLNGPSGTPDSISQTSERVGYNSFDGTLDQPAGEEVAPASPPETPPEVRYKPHHELHQEKLKETLEKEIAKSEQKQSQHAQEHHQHKALKKHREEKQTADTTVDARENIAQNSATKTSSSPPKRRLSVRLANSTSPESKKPEKYSDVSTSVTAPPLKLETDIPPQPKIIRLKFREPTFGDELRAENLSPSKRGRGRPRKIDPITGEPLKKRIKKKHAHDENPVIKRRKSSNGIAIKLKAEHFHEVLPETLTGVPPEVPAPLYPAPEQKAGKKRKSVEEPASYPHVNRKQKIINTSDEKVPRPAQHEHSLGLSNLGATCYINVVIQMLAHTESIRDYFLACDFSRVEANSKAKAKLAPKPKSQCVRRTRASEKTAEVLFPKLKGKLGEEFGILLRELLFDEGEGKKNGVASDQFWTALRANLEKAGDPAMDPNLVQDAHEFLILILDALTAESSPVVNGYTLPEVIDRAFSGVHSTTFECNNCHDTTRRQDKCMELEVPICKTLPELGKLEESKLEDHLKNYTLPEQQEWAADAFSSPEGEKMKACPKCGVDKGRSMRHNIMPKGENVCIELKRFLWEDGENRKVRGHVAFPMTGLNLGACADQAPAPATPAVSAPVVVEGATTGVTDPDTTNAVLYDLYGIVVHKGDKSTTGHYISYAKEKGSWLRFDDLKVHPVSEEEVARQEAYLLMYEQQTAHKA
ncbi:Ubiquitin carboxyl-terminal hydrolase 3 [Orbilia ellipsospora]|uniref:Ubiquitin carboxyl-terminal hydrolase n=1 Tax=Orbilia ellipsospora TaxID=2528407 RepID=A0AAV9WXB9_9PEZI